MGRACVCDVLVKKGQDLLLPDPKTVVKRYQCCTSWREIIVPEH